MGAIEIEAFLTDLAVVGKVAASTQNQFTRTCSSAVPLGVVSPLDRL